ncbi:MAG: hypothetical protein LUH02_07290 [Erysipelotrichaceae bacterium]|nr:hypothetical protein [Erysipelotrichaceae bacterium]
MQSLNHAKYLKNELENYMYMKLQIKLMEINQEKETKAKQKELEEVRFYINNAYVKSLSFDSVKSNAITKSDERTLKLLIKEESLTSEINKIESRYNKLKEMYQTRIDILDVCLEVINNEDDRKIIEDIFFNNKSYNEVSNKHHYSVQYLYKKVDKLINKMMKKL